MIPGQDAARPLRELTASVQDRYSTISSEHSSSYPNKSRELKDKDVITNTLYEQINKGRPEKIPDWKKVELMPIDEIEMENKQFTQKYEGVCVRSTVTLTEIKIMYNTYPMTRQTFGKISINPPSWKKRLLFRLTH